MLSTSSSSSTYPSTIYSDDDTCVPAFLHYIFTSAWELFILMFTYNVTMLLAFRYVSFNYIYQIQLYRSYMDILNILLADIVLHT